jgi:hypothetical protein
MGKLKVVVLKMQNENVWQSFATTSLQVLSMAVFDLCYPLATNTFPTIVQVIAESTAALYPGFLLR